MISIKGFHKGVSFDAQAEMVAGVLWVHSQGRTFAVEKASSSSKRFKAQKVGGGTIEAPMPGKITKVLKPVGAQVSRGESIIAMEAMKMEYTLKAELDGVISHVHFKAGDQVSLGACLVVITPSGEAQ